MNDSETVALIGGGHAVGRAHGACPAGPGPAPREDPLQSWPGQCGQGRAGDTYTSGYEMPFTSRPTTFDNEYFHNLLDYEWKLIKGSGDKNQWKPVSRGGGRSPVVPRAPRAHGPGQETIGMLTTDLALCADPDYNEVRSEELLAPALLCHKEPARASKVRHGKRNAQRHKIPPK